MEVWNSCFVLQLRRSDKRLKTAGLLCLYVWLRAKTALLMSIARETWQLSQAVCSSWQKNDACFGKTERWGWGDIQHWTLSTLPPPKKKNCLAKWVQKGVFDYPKNPWDAPQRCQNHLVLRVRAWSRLEGLVFPFSMACQEFPDEAKNGARQAISSQLLWTWRSLDTKTWSAAYSSAGKTAMVLLMEEILHHLGCIKPYK